MSWDKLAVLKEWLEKNLQKRFIQLSSLSAAALILFVFKSRRGLCLCMNYWGLNAITVKDCYLLPLTKKTLNNLKRMQFFSKIDIVSAFNKVCMHKDLKYLTAFQTQFSLYEFLMMLFDLIDASAIFQCFITATLQKYLNGFCTTYIDNILVYSHTWAEHKKHVWKVLEKLQKAGLWAKIEKCYFFCSVVKFFDLVIDANSIKMNLKKVWAIADWKLP